jgi:hypothetical protein
MNAPTPSTTTTLLAAANVARTGSQSQQPRRQPNAFDGLVIGQHLKFNVLRHLEQQRYEVALAGRRHVVESRVPLQTGAEIEAQVEAKGDQLELRYLGMSAALVTPESADVAAASSAADSLPPELAALAAQFRVPLDEETGATITKLAAHVDDPALMTRGGLFLQKIAQHVTPKDLDALYRVLSGTLRDTAALAPAASRVNLDDHSDGDDLATSLANAFDASKADSAAGGLANATQDPAADGDSRDDGQRARQLLNLQDDGSVAWRYGTLPLLVGGQLIELDLVMFREREPQTSRGGLRRLVMTLDTTHFGRVRVEARAIDGRLMVKLAAATPDAVDTLAAYGVDVRGALEQLGWAVDDVRYEIDAPNTGAAHAVVQHVLSAGTVDREL